MKKFFLHIFLLWVFALAFATNSARAAENPPQFARDTMIIQTQKGEEKYNIQLAISESEQEYGLMQRKELAKNSGMLFIANPERVMKMWMKNTLIPLDMLFIDNAGRIIYIAQNTKPNSLDIISAGEVKSKAVLEISGGQAEKQSIKIGDKIIYKAFKQ